MGFSCNRIAVAYGMVACLLAHAGCAKHYHVDPILDWKSKSNTYEIESSDGIGEDPVWTMNPFTFRPPGWPHDHTPYAIAIGAYESYSAEARKHARNELIEAMIAASDHNASVHLSCLKSTQSGVNLALGMVALGLSGSATVATEAAANALSAASTGVQGTRALVNEEVYVEALAESIIMLILEERRILAAAIREHYTDSLVEYPVQRGISEVVDYHKTGSTYYGLALARQAIERETIRKRPEIEIRNPTRGTPLSSARAQLNELAATAEREKAARDLLAAQVGDLRAKLADVEALLAADAGNAELVARKASVSRALTEAGSRLASSEHRLTETAALIELQRQLVAGIAELEANNLRSEAKQLRGDK